MSQAHVDALLVARDKLVNTHKHIGASRFICHCLPFTAAAWEIEAAIMKSLEGSRTLESWLKDHRGIDCWKPVKMRKIRIAWIDQMLIDWKDAP